MQTLAHAGGGCADEAARLAPGDPLIGTLAPGERRIAAPGQTASSTTAPERAGRSTPRDTAAPGGVRRHRRGNTNGGAGAPLTRERGAGRKAGAVNPTAKQRAVTARRDGSARAGGGKLAWSSGSLPAGSGGAAKASQNFRGRAR